MKLVRNIVVLLPASVGKHITSAWVAADLLPSLSDLAEHVKVMACRGPHQFARGLDLAKILGELDERDLVFILAHDRHFSHEELGSIAHCRARSMLYITDSDFDWPRVSQVARHVTYFCVGLKETSEYLKFRFPNIRWMPFPTKAKYVLGQHSDASVCFYGSATGVRARYLRYLDAVSIKIKSNITVDCRLQQLSTGPVKPRFEITSGWKSRMVHPAWRVSGWFGRQAFRGYKITAETLSPQMYEYLNGRSLIHLGISEYWDTDLLPQAICAIRGRDYEALASGAILVTRSTPETEWLISEGFNCFVYSDNSSLCEAIEQCSAMSKRMLLEMGQQNRQLFGKFVGDWAHSIGAIIDE